MARWHFPAWPDLAWATTRGLGWLTSLTAILLVGYIKYRWPDADSETILLSLLGAAVALLTDSWQAIALGGHVGFLPMTSVRTLVADFIALVLSLGGFFFILFYEFLFPQAHHYDRAMVAAALRLKRHRDLARGDICRAALCALATISLMRIAFIFCKICVVSERDRIMRIRINARIA